MNREALKELRAKIHAEPAEPIAVAALLDALPAAERADVVRGLNGSDLARLYQAVDGFRMVRLADLVPSSVPAMTEVRHFGKNSQLMFTHFEKRFFRPEGEDRHAPRELGGANFQAIQFLTGPGYFVVHEKPERPNEVEIDYRRVPAIKPEGWPAIEANQWRRGHIFYGSIGFMDTLRRVSEHVTIGSGHSKLIPAYFALCRDAVA
jgi:hypothetical protein